MTNGFVPTGYLTITQAAERLMAEYQADNINAKTSHLDLDSGESEDADARAEIGTALASKKLRAAAIEPDNGKMISIPDDFWRTQLCHSVIFEDWDISELFVDLKKMYNVEPLVAERDLQNCFLCHGDFQAPTVWPDAWGKECPFKMLSYVELSPDAGRIRETLCAAIDARRSVDETNSEDDAAAAEHEVILPQHEVMDAAEVLSWVAFRKSLPLSRWDGKIYQTSRQWPFGIGCFYSSKCLSSAIHEIGGPILLRKILKIEAEGRNWRGGQLDALVLDSEEIDAQFRTFMKRSDAVPASLLAELESDLADAEIVTTRIRQASGKLRRALESGRLRAAGGRANAYRTLMFSRNYIPAEDWKIGTELLPDGTMRERDGNKLEDLLLFETGEVMAVWPPQREDATFPLPDIEAPVPTDSASITCELDQAGRAGMWMQGYAKGFVDLGKKVKREDAIKACMTALPCVYLVAERAYEALPWPALRNKPRTTTS